MIGVSFVVLVYPYRLIWHNAFETAAYNDARCYILGEQAAKALIYCPGDAAPRVREIELPDRGLQGSGIFQSIYTR